MINKFDEGESVVWQGEFCKIIKVNDIGYTIKNFHSNTTMIVEESELRKPEQGEFLDSNSLNSPGSGNDHIILTKNKGGKHDKDDE